MPGGVIDTRPYIEVEEERPRLLNDNVRSLVMQEAEGTPCHVEVRLDSGAMHPGHGIDMGFEYSDTETLPLGKAFRVLFPARGTDEEEGPREIFEGRVSALEFVAGEDGTQELCILGEDALMGWRMCRRTRHFEGKAVKDMAADIARGTSLAGPVADYLSEQIADRHQANESDLSFLQRLLADRDADAQVVAGRLQIAPRADIQRGEVTVSLGTTLKSVRVAADLAHQRTTFSLSAWDHTAGEKLRKEMETEALGPGSGRRGADYLDPFGDTVEHFAAAPATRPEEAQALIDATGTRAARRFVTARGTAVGNPLLRVGTHLSIEGIGPRFSNTYYVTAACHRYTRDGEGYVTEFEAECAFFNGEVGT